jgi:WD40 repeat protein
VIELTDERLVSGGFDRTLRIWNTISGSCLMTLEGHTCSVYCLIQLTDGRLVSGSGDNTLKILDTISGICSKTLMGHNGTVNSVSQLIDGRIVSGSFDTTLRIWDTISGSCLITLVGHTSTVNSVNQLTDGRLVSSSDDKTLRIWNIMSLSQQKWIRRRLLVLLFEASKILSDPPASAMIHSEQYRQRRQELDLLFHCSLNISNNNFNSTDIDGKVYKITLAVLSMPEITIRVAEYL